MTTQEKSVIEVPELPVPERSDDSYAPCVRVGDWVYVSAMTGVDRDGTLVSSEFEPQVRRAFENIETVLDAAGSSVDDAYYVAVWLTDMRLRDAFLSVCHDVLGETKVSMTIVGAGGLVDSEARVAVETRALRSDASVEKTAVEVPELANDDHLPPTVAQAVAVGDLIFVSGQPGVDHRYDLVSIEFDPQMRRVLENVTAGLEAGGSATSDMLTTTTWMRDHRDLPSFHRRRSELLGADVSTSTRIGVTELSDVESFVEMEAVGVRSDVGKEMIDHPDGLPLATMEYDGETVPRFWQCVAAGKWIFTAGMVGVDEHFDTVSPAFEPQARKVFENLGVALDAAGADVDDLVHTRTYLSDMRYADEFLALRDETWGGTRATSTIAHSPLLAERQFRVEVEAIAVRPD